MSAITALPAKRPSRLWVVSPARASTMHLTPDDGREDYASARGVRTLCGRKMNAVNARWRGMRCAKCLAISAKTELPEEQKR